MKYPTYLPTDFVKQDDKQRFKSYLDGFKPLGSDYEPIKAAPDLFTEAARIAREKGYDDDAGRVVQAILRTEGALSGEVGDKDLPGGGSFGPLQFYRKYGMLPSYAKSLGVSEDDAAEHARKNPTHAIGWALGGYLGNAIREGQAKGLRGAELATYAQQHGQRSQAPERAGQNYSAMFGGGQPIPAHAPTTVGPREAAIPAHTPVGDKAEFGKYLSSFPELGSDLQMGKERAIPAHEPKDDKQAFGEFLDSFPKLGGDLLGGLGQAIGGLGRGQQEPPLRSEPMQLPGQLGSRPGEAAGTLSLPATMDPLMAQKTQEAARGLMSAAEPAAAATFAPLAGFSGPKESLRFGVVPLLQEGTQEMGRRWREEAKEALPGMKFGAEMLADPFNVPVGSIAKAAPRIVQAAGKALPEAGRLGRALAGEAGEQLLERTPMRKMAGGLGEGVPEPPRANESPIRPLAEQAAKEPWEMTKADVSAYLKDIHKQADDYANERLSLKPTEAIDIESQYKLEKGKLAKLDRQYESTQMPSESFIKARQAQRAKVEALRQRVEVHQAAKTTNTQERARLEAEYLIKNYPTLYESRGDYPYALGTAQQGRYLVGGHRAAVRDALTSGKPVPPEVLRDYPDLAASQTPIKQIASEPPLSTPAERASAGALGTPAPKEPAPILYHGTKADFIDTDIATGKKMFGIHLTTDPDAAKEYGKVKAYALDSNAKILDLSDGDNLWEFMSRQGILDEDDLANVDLENYVRSGQLYQYDISSRTHLADDVARTVLDLGYDGLKMPDNLRGLGDDIAWVVVNPKALRLPETARAPMRTLAGDLGEAVPEPPEPIKEPLTKPPAIKGKGEKVEQGPQVEASTQGERTTKIDIPGAPEEAEALKARVQEIGAKEDYAKRAINEAGNQVRRELDEGKIDLSGSPDDVARRIRARQDELLQEKLRVYGEQPVVKKKPKTRDAAETVAEEGAEQGVQSLQGDEAGVPRGAPVKPPTVAIEPPNGKSWLPTVKPTKKVIEAAYNPDWLRRLADKLGGTPLRRLTPGLGIQDITKKGEQTLADVGQVLGMPKRDVFTEATVLRESIMADWKSGVVGATSRLRSQGDTKGLFKVDKDGLADIAGTKVPINDVLEYPARYNLSSEQRAYAETMHRLYDEQKLALAGEGIEIRELGFDVGGHYVGRRVLGKVDEQGNVEIGEIVGTGGKRIGAKMGFEKGRQFKTQAEAIKEGFRYLTPEETLQMNLEAAGRRIADKRMADYVLERIPYRTGAAPEELKLARDFAKDKLFAVAKLKAVVNRGYRGERVPTNVITSIGRFFPDQAKGLIEAGITRPEDIITRAGLQQVEAAIPNLKTQSQAAYYKAQNVLTKAGEKARQPKYGEGTVQTPAFQAKFFSAEDAKKLRQILDLEKSAPLRGLAQSISYVNALPRLLLTTYDIGTPLIHGQIALFSHPIVWGKATGRMAQALVSEKGYQTFLKTHADTIQKWSQDGAIFTSSEFTEAAQPGRLTSKIPGVKQFGRGFEGLLNASRIYGLEATEHMAKTQQDRADLAKFWNEMSGVVNTARMGISPTQRELETAILFAPRYRRAMLTLMTDIAKGGLRGQMARDAVGKATVAGLLGYVGVAYALGQQPHLDPREGGKFLTVEIAGQNVGLGGAFYSTSRTLLQMALEPEKAPEIATKYVQYSLSPTVGTAIDIYQKPYLYQGALKLTERVLAENLTPFWTQAMLLDEQEGSEAAAATAMEFAGLRTFPDKKQGGRSFKYPGPPTNIAPKIPGPTQFKYPGAAR